jgi:DNA-binding LacI/PurR family transcriptional regulator
LQKGHTRIAFLTPSQNIWQAPRLRGYINAMEDNNCFFDEKFIQFLHNTECEKDFETVSNLLSEQKATAILCSSDRIALRVHKVIRQKGLKMPDDVALIGFNNVGISRLLSPALTTVDRHLEKFGEAAVNLLERRRAGFDINNESIKIIPTLIERETT